MELPEGFCNVRYVFTVGGVADPMGFSIACQPDPARSVESCAAAAYTNFIGIFIATAASVMEGWTFQGVTATLQRGGEPLVGEFFAPITGTATDDTPACNLSVLVRKNTSAGGRKNRGRMFVPPYNLWEANVDAAGNILNTYVSIQTNGWNAWRDEAITDEMPPWLLHSNPADAPTPIASFSCQGLAATQRRRMR